MKYKKSERVQLENYSSIEELLADAIEVINDEDNIEKSINIVTNQDITEKIIEYIEQSDLDFKFDIQSNELEEKNFDDVNEYLITIINTGEIWIDSAKDTTGKYFEIDGFMYVHRDIDQTVYGGRNRRNDVMIFDL